MSWIQTYLGGAFDFEELLAGKKQRIEFEDVAHSLSQKCRFSGHCTRFISVAEHQVAVRNCVAQILHMPTPPNGLPQLHSSQHLLARQFSCVHDSPESYTGDSSFPLKLLFRNKGITLLDEIEDLIEKQVIDQLLGVDEIPQDVRKVVKYADLVCLAWEKVHAMGVGPRDDRWSWLPPPMHAAALEFLWPPQAKKLYLDACAEEGIPVEV